MGKEIESKRMIQIECDAMLFDLDGVLIDSTVCIKRHWQQWAQQHSLDMANIMQVAHGRRTVETIRLVAPHLCAEEEAEHFAAVEAADTQGVITIEGASPLLNSLPMDTWAIATSGTRDVATARLKHVGLPIPSILVTAEDVTSGKPDPEPYLAAAKGLGIPADKCVVIEDSPAGIEAGCSAGMQTVAIATTHAHHDLGKANVIARHLCDIHIENGSSCRLAIRIESDIIPVSANR
jgi:sugar-phosphatase